jgi:hypothetical protein
MTLAGIEPATFRIAAQRLNQMRQKQRASISYYIYIYICYIMYDFLVFVKYADEAALQVYANTYITQLF